MSDSVPTPARDAVAWDAFWELPALQADPKRLAACFDGAIGEEACEHMLQSERLRQRLSALLLDRLQMGREPIDVSDADAVVALSDAEKLEQIAFHAGAVYWSASFAGSILGSTAARLHEQLGEPVYSLAVANRELAGPPQDLQPWDGLRDRVLADGWRCVGAWCHAVPTAVGRRVLVKLPPDELIDTPPGATFGEQGTAIARRVAEALG